MPQSTIFISELPKYNVAVGTEVRQPGCDQRIVNGATMIHSGGLDPPKGVALVLRTPISDSLDT